MGFGFPNPIPSHWDNVSIFLLGHLTLLSPLVCFLFMFWVLLGVSCSFMQVSYCLTCHTLGWIVLESGGSDPWKINPLSWTSLLSRTISPWDSSKQIPKQTKFCSLGQLLDFWNIIKKSQLNIRGHDFFCFVVTALALKPIKNILT